MRGAYRVRLVANLLNGSTAAGILVAVAGRARLARARDGLVVALRYRLPVPPAPAFCLGNVIVTRLDAEGVRGAGSLLAHEARHATQFACCGGVIMLPLYFLAAGLSWLLTGDFSSQNIFERRAGLADGGYAERPLRPVLGRVPLIFAVASGRMKGDGEAGGGSQGGGGGHSGAMGDDDNAARRPSGGRAAG